MSKRIDITGLKYGRLTAVKWISYKNQQSQWECVCDCGQPTIASKSQLESGNTSSCGCLRKELAAIHMHKLVGKCRCSTIAISKKLTYYIRNAKRRGHKWYLTPRQFEKLIKKSCFYCGSATKVGVDRVNSTLAYKISNVVPCCTYCNQAKNDRTLGEFANWIRQASNHLAITDWSK